MATPSVAEQRVNLFISYQRADEEWTKELAYRLRKRDVRVFLASDTINPGENFVDRIDNALASASFFGIVLSPEAVTAAWPLAERAAAILTDPGGTLGRVIPLLRKSCQIPPLLRFRQYIDFRDDAKFDVGLRRLVAWVRGEKLEKEEPLPSGDAAAIPALANAVLPDPLEEELFSNLLPVQNLPNSIWSAPTSFERRSEVLRYFGQESFAPPLALRERRLFTFVDLNRPDNPFVGAIEPFGIQQHSTASLIADEDRSRWLMDLLNDTIRSHTFLLGLGFDEAGKRHFFEKGTLASERVAWTPHTREGSKFLILEYRGAGGGSLYVHRAVALQFEVLGGVAFLRLEPGWVFTLDGKKPVEGRRRTVLSVKFLSSQRNLRDFAELRFWAWLLSDDGKTIRMNLGDRVLEIATRPVSTMVFGGIFGDSKPLPTAVKAPPDLFTREHEEVEETTGEESAEEDFSDGES